MFEDKKAFGIYLIKRQILRSDSKFCYKNSNRQDLFRLLFEEKRFREREGKRDSMWILYTLFVGMNKIDFGDTNRTLSGCLVGNAI